MNDSNFHVTWVLGAGFSKGLGGPLLTELFTAASARQLLDYFQHNGRLYDKSASAARALYNLGRFGTSISGTPKYHEAKMWSDPEEFLDRVDGAAKQGEDSRAWKWIHRLTRQAMDETPGTPLQITPKDLSNTGRRLLAAECSAFLHDADPLSEKWTPYRDWLRKLDVRRDRIITFNYDCVLETIVESLPDSERRLDVRLPETTVPGSVPVLKLHGSIDWIRSGNSVQRSNNRFFAVDSDDEELAIATPGPSKQTAVNDLFEKLWSAAESAIEIADAIMFVGYRFPPTDSTARTRLLSAIKRSTRKPRIHIVLGPDTTGASVRRLSGLAGFALRDVKTPIELIHAHPLYAEDFFSVYDPDSFHRQFR